MAAPTTEISGKLLLLTAGGNAIGGDKSCTLSYSVQTGDVTDKLHSNWYDSLPFTRSHTYQFESGYVESSAELGGDSLGLTIGGNALKGVTSMSLNFSQALGDVVNTTQTLDRGLIPHMRKLELTVEGDYYDPAGSGADALSDTLDEMEGTTSSGLALVATFGSNQSYSFTARPTAFNVSAPMGTQVTNSITFEAITEVTDVTTGADTGLAALITAIHASEVGTSLSAKFATTTTGATQWTSTVFPSTIGITVPYTGPVVLSGTLEGDGAPTRATTS